MSPPARSPEALLRDPTFRARLVRVLRDGHARIAREVRRALDPLVRAEDWDSAMAVAGPGAGDLVYRIDAVAESAVERMAEELGRLAPVRLLCEGPGEILRGGPEPILRVLVDPIDGTRNLMADLRSAWVLTGIALEGKRTLTTADLRLSLQSEIPPFGGRRRREFLAMRGEGCAVRTLAFPSGRSSAPRRWRAPRSVDLRGGYFPFLRFLPHERPLLALAEAFFFARAERGAGLDPSRAYDDQWLCAAGQLVLVSSGRSRMFADLRAWLAAETGQPTMATHPYDLCAVMTATEAGSPVLAVDRDLRFPRLAAPLDLETNVSFVAFPNETARRALLPALRGALLDLRRELRHGHDASRRR